MNPVAPLLRVENLRPSPTDPAFPRLSTSHLENFSLTLGVGEVVAIVGSHGVGKTALMRALALVQAPATGRVFFNNREITAWRGGRLRGLRSQFQYVGGHPLRTFPPRVTLRAALLEPMQIHWRGSKMEQATRLQTVTALLELNPLLLDRRIESFSVTLRQRAALARALMLQPRLLMVDELIERLDPAAALPLLSAFIGACRQNNIALVWTTTNLPLATQFSNRVIPLTPV